MIFMPLIKSICGCLADKESAFRSTTSGNCTEHPQRDLFFKCTKKRLQLVKYLRSNLQEN